MSLLRSCAGKLARSCTDGKLLRPCSTGCDDGCADVFALTFDYEIWFAVSDCGAIGGEPPDDSGTATDTMARVNCGVYTNEASDPWHGWSLVVEKLDGIWNLYIIGPSTSLLYVLATNTDACPYTDGWVSEGCVDIGDGFSARYTNISGA